MKTKEAQGQGSIVAMPQICKLRGFRLLGHPTDPNVGALELRGDGGATTYLVTRQELAEMGTALNSLAEEMSRSHRTTPVVLDSDTFHFAP
jgi:hypothetical protein